MRRLGRARSRGNRCRRQRTATWGEIDSGATNVDHQRHKGKKGRLFLIGREDGWGRHPLSENSRPSCPLSPFHSTCDRPGARGTTRTCRPCLPRKEPKPDPWLSCMHTKAKKQKTKAYGVPRNRIGMQRSVPSARCRMPQGDFLEFVGRRKTKEAAGAADLLKNSPGTVGSTIEGSSR